jgi:hypothetical protein
MGSPTVPHKGGYVLHCRAEKRIIFGVSTAAQLAAITKR